MSLALAFLVSFTDFGQVLVGTPSRFLPPRTLMLGRRFPYAVVISTTEYPCWGTRASMSCRSL
jgi:hypothetical protein